MDKKPCILIVEDSGADIDLLIHILGEGNSIHIAKTGEAAIKIANEFKPDLILLDIILPGLSGFDVLAMLKNADETRNIPVVVVTGLNNARFEEKAFALGAVDYITKPFRGTIVQARIGLLLQRLRYVETIEESGLVDKPTGLPNRRCFDERIGTEWQRAIREKTPLSLLMLDIDLPGVDREEKRLRSFAGIVSRVLKRPADLVALWERNRFAVLLPNTESEGACKLARKILERPTATPISDSDSDLPAPVVSIGIVTQTPTSEEELDAFIQTACARLADARDAGGNVIRS